MSITKILNFFRRRKDSVDNVISAFNAQIKRLERIAEREHAEVERKEKEILKLQQTQNDHREHSMRALNVSEKFKALIA